MDALKPEDLGLSEEQFEGLAHSLSLPIFLGGEEDYDEETDPFFDLAIFVVPAGGEIPLHDHPHSEYTSCGALEGIIR